MCVCGNSMGYRISIWDCPITNLKDALCSCLKGLSRDPIAAFVIALLKWPVRSVPRLYTHNTLHCSCCVYIVRF